VTPAFTFLVPTHSPDRPLRRCLDSVASQLGPDDEVIVIGDTFDGDMPGVEALVNGYGFRFRYVAHNAGRHSYGHDQLNVGIGLARGTHIQVNDDDDIWTPDALKLMRIGVEAFPKRPLLFRFKSHFQMIFWDRVGSLERNHIGGHCLVAPNVPGKLGRFTCEYAGDYEYVSETVNAYGGATEAIWISDVICVARPTDELAAAMRNQGTAGVLVN
jgi:glycosyltransferase involved in cell wall biosynthesis